MGCKWMNIEPTSLYPPIFEEIESLSDTSFLTAESISDAVKILENEPLHFQGDFADDEWIFYKDNLNTGLKRKFNFEELKSYEYVGQIPKDFQVIVKCWVADLISKYHATTVAGYYLKMLRFLEYTNGFDQEKEDEFILWFTSTQTISNQDKQNTIYVILNFLDYADIEAGEVYIKPLIRIPILGQSPFLHVFIGISLVRLFHKVEQDLWFLIIIIIFLQNITFGLELNDIICLIVYSKITYL